MDAGAVLEFRPMRTERITVEELSTILVQHGLLTQEQGRDAVVRSDGQRARLSMAAGRTGTRSRVARQNITAIQIMSAFGFRKGGDSNGVIVDEARIVQTLAQHVDMEFVTIDPLKLDANLITSTVSLPFARRTSVLPLRKEGDTLVVAVSDPWEGHLFEELAVLTRMQIRPVLSLRSDIQRIITEVYGFKRSVAHAAKDMAPTIDIGNLEQLTRLGKVDEIEANDQHVVNAVDYILHYAFDQRASDIHIEPKREHSQVRMRIDGVLHDIYKIPKAVHPAMVSRLKTMSRLDLAERRRQMRSHFIGEA